MDDDSDNDDQDDDRIGGKWGIELHSWIYAGTGAAQHKPAQTHLLRAAIVLRVARCTPRVVVTLFWLHHRCQKKPC